MDDKLLNEISRFRKLSGLMLINEQGVLIDNLLSLTGKRIKNVDDFIDALNLTGKNLTDDQIDSLVDEMVDAGAMLPNSGKLLKQELKANAKLRSALSNRSEDFVSAVKNAGKKENLVGLWGAHILNKSQVLVVYTKLVKQFLDLAGSNTQLMFDSIDNEFASYLQQIYDSGIGLHSIDEVWDVIDGNILEHVNTSGFSPELAEAHFKEFSKKIKEGSKTKEILDKINAEGRNAGKPKRTTPVTEYKPDYKIPEEWAGTPKKLIHRDEAGKTIKYSDSTPIKVDGDNLPAKVDDGGLPSLADESEDIFDVYELIDDGTGGGTGGGPRRDPFPNGVPDPSFMNNFFFRFCKMGFCEVLIDFFRSLGKRPADFARDMLYTQQRIIELTEELGRLNPGDARYKQVTKELDGWVNRLKSNTKMVSTPDAGFLTQWEMVESQIRRTLSDHPDLANEVIEYCKNKAVTSGGETIQEFMDLLLKHSQKTNVSGLIDLREILTPEFWRNWRNTKMVEYANEVKAAYKEAAEKGENKITKGVRGVMGGVAKLLVDFWNTCLKRAGNFLLFGTFRYFKDIIKRLRVGNYTNVGSGALSWFTTAGIKRYALLYVELVLISNVVEPFWEYAKDLLAVDLEARGIEVGEEKNSPEENLIKNLLEKIPFWGNEFEWNPFFNTLSVIPGVGEVGEVLGFRRAPLPEAIVRGLGWLYDLWKSRSKGNTAKNMVEERRKALEAEFNEATNIYISKVNNDSELAYQNNPQAVEQSNGKEKILKDISEYTNAKYVVYYPDFDLLSIDEAEKIRNALTFQPGVPPDVENTALKRESTKRRSVRDKDGKFIGHYYPNEKNTFVPNEIGEQQGLTSSETIPDGAKVDYPTPDSMLSDIKNLSGYWSLKSKDGKFYQLKPNENGFMYYLTPSIDEMKKNPNVKTTLNNIQKFLEKL
jgi:polyhydroxyalkanoate synthesis regulator phasin